MLNTEVHRRLTVLSRVLKRNSKPDLARINQNLEVRVPDLGSFSVLPGPWRVLGSHSTQTFQNLYEG